LRQKERIRRDRGKNTQNSCAKKRGLSREKTESTLSSKGLSVVSSEGKEGRKKPMGGALGGVGLGISEENT